MMEFVVFLVLLVVFTFLYWKTLKTLSSQEPCIEDLEVLMNSNQATSKQLDRLFSMHAQKMCKRQWG